MTRNPTTYYRPDSIEQAVKLITQTHLDTALISGGALRLGRTTDPDFEAVVDLQAIPGLDRIERMVDGRLRIGANATLQAAAAHDHTPLLLREALTRALPWNRRNAITFGEAVEFARDTAILSMAEVTAALLALGAEVVVARPQEQRYPLEAVESALAQPRLPERGLIVALEVALPGPYSAFAGETVARTPADAAIVSAAGVVTTAASGVVTAARLALSGVWPVPAALAEAASAALLGRPLDDASSAAALAALDGEIAPLGDFRGSAEYRRAMAGVLTGRVLAACRAHYAAQRGDPVG